MVTKRFIKQNQILLSGALHNELELPGEPLIYSIKYKVGNRSHSVQFFRNMKWSSLLRSWFRFQSNTKVPVVILVRFYVSPPSDVIITKEKLRRENVPAVRAFEISEYLLSFQEMLHHVLFNSYRQVVKIDAEKFYSSNPRTVFKFMTWDQYVKLQNCNSIHSSAQSVGEDGEGQVVQP